jgi:hypothetical protein
MSKLGKLHNRDKKIIFFTEIDEIVTLYNGSTYENITMDEKRQMFIFPYKYDFILIPYRDNDIENDYKKYLKDIDLIKEHSNINMFRTGMIGNTALCHFDKYNNVECDNINEYEIKFLANGGGVRVAEPYEGKAYKYDINSYYPSIMNSKINRLPTKKGTLTIINQEEFDKLKYCKIGVYNVKIECDNPKIFTLLKSNMYSHHEINYAKKLNLKMTVNGEHLLFNPKECLSFNSVFNKYVNELYDLKTDYKPFKLILNSLWGSLCSRIGGQKTIFLNPEKFNIPDSKILKMEIYKDDIYKIQYHAKVKGYKFGFSRLNPFLLGFARVNMHKTFEKIGYEYVKYSHTDSIITSRRLHNNDLKFSDEMGDWKFEGISQNCKITNMNKYKF